MHLNAKRLPFLYPHEQKKTSYSKQQSHLFVTGNKYYNVLFYGGIYLYKNENNKKTNIIDLGILYLKAKSKYKGRTMYICTYTCRYRSDNFHSLTERF